MTFDTIVAIWGWCSAIAFAVMLLWLVFYKFAPGMVYWGQQLFFKVSAEEVDREMYHFFALFKLGAALLFYIPFIAMLIAR